MIKKFRALAAVGALTAVLATGCGGQKSGPPEPGAQPKDWCFADSWVDRASYDYAYWQENRTHTAADVATAMGYGHRLMDLYQQDRKAGQLPEDVQDEALKAWSLNLAHVQGDTTQSAAMALSKGGFIRTYLNQVHAACN